MNRPVPCAIVVLFLFQAVAFGAIFGSDRPAGKNDVVREVAEDWIRIGTEQLRRGYYEAAAGSLQQAKSYGRALTDEQNKRIEKLLAKTRQYSEARQRLESDFETADSLIEQDSMFEARSFLQALEASEFLTAAEKQRVRKRLAAVNGRIDDRVEKINDIHRRCVEHYRNGRIPEARQCLAEIDLIFADVPDVSSPLVVESPPHESERLSVGDIDSAVDSFEKSNATDVAAAEAGPSEGPVVQDDVAARRRLPTVEPVVEEPDRRTILIRHHTRALVEDALEKARRHIERGRLEQAMDVLRGAVLAVESNEMHLTADSFSLYHEQLNRLIEEVGLRQSQALTDKR